MDAPVTINVAIGNEDDYVVSSKVRYDKENPQQPEEGQPPPELLTMLQFALQTIAAVVPFDPAEPEPFEFRVWIDIND